MLDYKVSSPTTPTVYHRAACGIEDNEEETFVITGGYDGDRTGRVTKYNKAGLYTDLPTLINARSSHGCGHYRNSNNQKVRIRQ